jgi:hypothetical protein
MAMDLHTVLGCLLVAGSLGTILYLVLRSRRRIDRIAESGYRSARQIIKDTDRDG